MAVVVGVVTVPALPAAAHSSDPSVRPVLDAVQPALPGVTVQIAASVTAQLVVANPTPTTLSSDAASGVATLIVEP